MKKIFFPIVMMASLLVAGCVKENLVEPNVPQSGVTVLTANVDAATRTVLQDDQRVLWTNGDKINVNGVESAALELDEAVASAQFTFEGLLESPYKAVFPSSIYKNETTVTLPAYQTYKEGSFAATASPMAAVSATSSLQFNHLCSVIKLTVNMSDGSEHDNIEYVDFYGKNNEQVSGDFSINFETLSLSGTSTADADRKIRYKVSKTLGEESFVMYIVVPAQEYASGYTSKVLDDKGHFMEKSKASGQTLVAGKIYDMPEFDFVPTDTDLDVEIATAEDLIDFATDYNTGKYADEDLLTVALVQDITFDAETSAAYAATGGIGTADDAEGNTNYFNGVFDGKGFSIKNWNSTCPLFAYTSAGSVVENMTIDASCTLTANYAGNNQYYGAFVGYHRGLLTNCHVNANLVASGNWGEAEPHIGALAGRVVVGKIENCTVNGDVTFDNTLVTSGQTSYFGGAVGRVSNANGELNGISIKGNVSLSAGSTFIADGSSNKSDAVVKYGGIVGSLAGTCTECHLTEADKTFFYGNFVYGSGVDPVNNNYRTQQVGGIVGEIAESGAVSNCNNYAQVTFNQSSGDGDVSRYLYAGGIAGQIYGDLSYCTMYGSLENRSSCLQQYIGGVVGNVQAQASVHNCANEGAEVSAGTAGNSYYQARNNNIGGVIGATFSTDLSNLTNKAELLCSRMNSNANATLSMGGVIGKIEATAGEIDGKGNIVNYATIRSNHGQYSNKYTAIGGVVGEAKCSVKGVVNEGSALYTINSEGTDHVYKHIWVGGVVGYANGNLTLTSLDNKGTAVINISKSIAVKHFDLCVGGVLGTNADAQAVALVECENSGSVAIQGGGTKTNGRSVAVGGVVGALTNGASSISSCSNTGCLSNTSSNNTNGAWLIRTAGGCNYLGGIAGYLEGAEGDLLEFTGCVNNRIDGTEDGVGNGTNAIYTLRGSSAGLVGGAKYADIKNSQCTTKIYNTNSTTAAGLVAALNLSNLERCTLTNSIVRPNGGGLACGGIAGYAYSSTVKENTLNNLQITGIAATNTGVLAGDCNEATVFTDNAVSGSVLDTAITLDTKMIGTGTPTVTGTYLLD